MSTATATTDTQTVITLKGSIQIVSEFFHTAINSILYQRGIYQPETFRRDSKYGLTVLITTDNGLLEYLDNVMKQMEVWLTDGDVQRLVVVVTGLDSGETLERWQFNVSVEKDGTNDSENSGDQTNTMKTSSAKVGKKSIRDIHNEIQAIIRQITASVSSFHIIFYLFFELHTYLKVYNTDEYEYEKRHRYASEIVLDIMGYCISLLF